MFQKRKEPPQTVVVLEKITESDFFTKPNANASGSLTFEKAKKLLRKNCPDAVINELIRSKNPSEKIAPINEVLDKIAKKFKNNDEIVLKMLSYEHVAHFIVNEPKKIADASEYLAKNVLLKIGKENLYDKFTGLFGKTTVWDPTGLDKYHALAALANYNFVNLIVNQPKLAVSLSEKIIDKTGPAAFCAVGALSNDKIFQALLSNPEKTISALGDLAKVSKNSQWDFYDWAFGLVSNDAIAPIFISNPKKIADVVGEIIKHFPDSAGDIFDRLTSNGKNTKKFAELCQKGSTKQVIDWIASSVAP